MERCVLPIRRRRARWWWLHLGTPPPFSRFWWGPAGDTTSLVKHVRPVFQALVPKAMCAGWCLCPWVCLLLCGAKSLIFIASIALNRPGIHVVVVTFSAQTALIREVLAAAFSPDVGRAIVVRGSDGTWQYEGRGCVGGKQAHIASAYEELNMKRSSGCAQAGALVTRRSTLLIDDEIENVEAALRADTNAVLFNYKEPEVSFVQSLLTLPDGR